MIQNIPIALDHMGLKSIHADWFRAEEQGKNFKSDVEIGYNIDIVDGTLARVSMIFKEQRILEEGDERLFTLQTEIMGFFRTSPECPQDQRQNLLRINGLNILYGALRGMLLSMSGCFPPGFRYTLPTINLQQVVQAVEAKRAVEGNASNEAQVRETAAPPFKPALKSKRKVSSRSGDKGRRGRK